MKSLILFILFSASMLVSAQDPGLTKRLEEINKQFELLPAEEKKKYFELKQKASNDFNLQKYLTCIVAVNDARQIFNDDFDLLYFWATCHANLRDYKKAAKLYNQVLELNPQHVSSLVSLIDIDIYEGRYEEAMKRITSLNKLINSISPTKSSLLDFKYLLCMTKLSMDHPGKYDEEIKKMQGLYTEKDDDLYFYYVQALKEFTAGKREEGLVWIMRSYLIFRNVYLMEAWNKLLLETGYVFPNEIMVNQAPVKK